MTRFIRIVLRILCFACIADHADAQITLDYCLDKARENYPLIRKYGIIQRTSDINLSDISKSWLPQLSINAQATVQNAVPAFPDALQGMLNTMGQDMQGLSKAQYKAGVELSQTVWDGGSAKSRRQAARASREEQKAALDVELYTIRGRVESLYFGILLIEKQVAQLQSTLTLLDSNLRQMKVMFANGAAMRSDVDMVEAQMLSVEQQLSAAKGSGLEYRRMLELFIGEPLADRELVLPDDEIPQNLLSLRPELHLFDSRINVNNTRLAAMDASLMPRIDVFSQLYYGYPGFDYFSAMRSRNLSLNVLAGIKVSWNLSALYTRRNDKAAVYLANLSVDADRQKFLFESNLNAASQEAAIETMRQVMKDDARISSLRASVRKAAESQLKNGVIDTTALLSKINDENQTNLSAAYHEIELIRRIYQLRNTLNR